MARLNTRDAQGKLRLFTSQGNIFPGGNLVPYFAAPYEPLGDSTPGNSVLKGEVRKVVGSATPLPQSVNFDDNTLLLLDSRQKVFTAAQIVRLAKILELDTSPPGATIQRAQEATTAAQESTTTTQPEATTVEQTTPSSVPSQEATTAEQTVPSWQEVYGAH